MYTLADVSLEVARVCTSVLTGKATGGDTTSLTDSVNLVQGNAYFDHGTVWIRSGDNEGVATRITGQIGNKIKFAELGDPIAAGDLYAVARSIYPWDQLATAINNALADIYVIEEDSSHSGDGSELEFVLPGDVADVVYIEVEDANGRRNRRTHWKEHQGAVRFDYGFAPGSGDVLHIGYKTAHPLLFNYADPINKDINLQWLKWQAAEYLLYWGVERYGEMKEYRIEEYLNRAMDRVKRYMPVAPVVRVRTAGS